MPIGKKNIHNLLPVAIMAHNEEKVVRKAVQSVLNQQAPTGYQVKVVVGANGCTDSTEEIVHQIIEEEPNKILLLSMKEKGKTKAINKLIEFLEELSNNGSRIPYVAFLDADCEFIGHDVLINFVHRLELNPDLCAVAATTLPDVFFNARKDFVAKLYRSVHNLRESLRINTIRGAGYCIRYDILKRIDFPDLQLAEDMYVSYRLAGRFLRDNETRIAFKTPANLLAEIHRRTRQEISTKRCLEYCAHLKKRGTNIELFRYSLGDNYRWGALDDNIIKRFSTLKSTEEKLYVLMYAFIRLIAKVRGMHYIRKTSMLQNIDYWSISR